MLGAAVAAAVPSHRSGNWLTLPPPLSQLPRVYSSLLPVRFFQHGSPEPGGTASQEHIYGIVSSYTRQFQQDTEPSITGDKKALKLETSA